MGARQPDFAYCYCEGRDLHIHHMDWVLYLVPTQGECGDLHWESKTQPEEDVLPSEKDKKILYALGVKW